MPSEKSSFPLPVRVVDFLPPDVAYVAVTADRMVVIKNLDGGGFSASTHLFAGEKRDAE